MAKIKGTKGNGKNLKGTNNNDQIIGKACNDKLLGRGGDGDDNMFGGNGDDSLFFNSSSSGRDDIRDFKVGTGKIFIDALAHWPNPPRPHTSLTGYPGGQPTSRSGSATTRFRPLRLAA